MAAADKAAVDSGTSVEVLMDRAGRAVARAAIRMLGGRYGKKVVVVCGKGNNGGDGYAAARVLLKEGVSVRCLAAVDPSELTGAALHHFELGTRAGVPVRVLDGRIPEADVIVDALFGTGFKGAADGAAAAAIETMNAHPAPVLSVDIPSGVDGSTGAVTGPAVSATLTIPMGAEKIGTAVGTGAELAGRVEVADIGITVPGTDVGMATLDDARGSLPPRGLGDHKRSRGSIALIGGTAGMSGAVVLCARGAMRSGVGYVTAGLTEAVQPTVAAAVPEVVTRILTTDEFLGPKALDEFASVLDKATVVVVGPGLGQGDAQRALVHALLADVEQPLVLDADALNVLAGDVEPLAERKWPTAITPHPAELARLMDDTVDRIQADRAGAARAAGERLGCIVILKGFRSVISDGQTVVVNPTGGPALATAGTGDVLTGVLSAFLAFGSDPLRAAVAAAFVHGRAGELVPSGAVAWDIAESLPRAIDELFTVHSPAPGAAHRTEKP
jgi:NAD(P)H-hydrate epimerase